MYGPSHQQKKKEGQVCKLMYNESFESQPDLQKILIQALEKVAWHKQCDLMKLPVSVEEEVAEELDYVRVRRAGHVYYVKNKTDDAK